MIARLRLIFFISLSYIAFSCGEGKIFSDNLPPVDTDSLISQEKMVLILSDIHILEAGLQLNSKGGVPSDTKSGVLYKEVFLKHHVSQYRYEESLKYYRQNPDLFSKMYDEVIKNLDRWQMRFQQ